MKILLIGLTKLKFMPYMHFYLNNINCFANEVHIIYWNRDGQKEDVSKYSSCQLHEFDFYQEDDVPKITKIKSFVKYREYATHIIKREKYDFIIVLHSLTGVLISDLLDKKFKQRYIFDYRDSTYERFGPFRWLIARLVEGSKATFVSSDGFRVFLPDKHKNKIYTSHNLLLDSLSHRSFIKKTAHPKEKVRIAFWGYIRHEAINREIIRKISCDDRFELHYYGREQRVAFALKAYAQEIKANNVFFHGEYTAEDRYTFAANTDLIHNIYCDDNTMLAMGNKFYDGLIFYIPQMCIRGSVMGKMAQEYGVGLECDPYDDQFTNQLWDYYNGMNKSFFANCDNLLKQFLLEYDIGRMVIKDAISD